MLLIGTFAYSTQIPAQGPLMSPNPCQLLEKAAISEDWQTFPIDPESTLVISLPGEPISDTTSWLGPHGGSRWSAEHLTITVNYGHWDESSFDPEDWKGSCLMPLGGYPSRIFLSSSPSYSTVYAWIVEKSELNEKGEMTISSFDPVIKVSAKSDEVSEKAFAVLRSIRRQPVVEDQ